MDLSKELLSIVNDKEDKKMSKRATTLLSSLYTIEEKSALLNEQVINFITKYKLKDNEKELVDPLTEAPPKKKTSKKVIKVQVESPQ